MTIQTVSPNRKVKIWVLICRNFPNGGDLELSKNTAISVISCEFENLEMYIANIATKYIFGDGIQ